MIEIRPSGERGYFDHGWLKTWHTFSFGQYRDPDHVRFGPLRVLNQDIVQPGKGFGTHPHDNMEILTWILSGMLEHEDSMGNGSRITPGEIQYMSAGTGVTHSEFNGSDSEPVHLLQMWLLPARRDTEPRYDQRAFTAEQLAGRLALLASGGEKDGVITVGQDVRLYAARLAAGDETVLDLVPGRTAWVHVATGAVGLNNQVLEAGDGAGVRDEVRLTFTGRTPAELVVFDLPA